MSHSYRRPYAAVTGVRSAKQDKIMANRGVRRAQNLATKRMLHDEDVLMPHRLECAWNDVYCWGRDGSQFWQVPDARQWSSHCLQINGLYPYSEKMWQRYLAGKPPVWPPAWYTKLLRK